MLHDIALYKFNIHIHIHNWKCRVDVIGVRREELAYACLHATAAITCCREFLVGRRQWSACNKSAAKYVLVATDAVVVLADSAPGRPVSREQTHDDDARPRPDRQTTQLCSQSVAENLMWANRASETTDKCE